MPQDGSHIQNLKIGALGVLGGSSKLQQRLPQTIGWGTYWFGVRVVHWGELRQAPSTGGSHVFSYAKHFIERDTYREPQGESSLMTVKAELLREIHRIHQQLADLNERLERGPKQLRAREANVTLFEEALANAEKQVQQTRLAGDQKQLDLQTSESKIEDLRGKLNTSTTNKEFHALQEQIAATEMANSVLADEILETFEKVDQLLVEAGKAKEELAAGEAELTKFAKQQAEDAESIRHDIVRLEADLIVAEKQLLGNFREDYNRVIRNMGADGMSAAEGRICTGCGQQMTLNMQNDLMLSKPMFCKACGRMLYVAE